MKWLSQKTRRIEQVAGFLKQKHQKPFYEFNAEIPRNKETTLLSNYIGSVVALDYGFWRVSNGDFIIDYYKWAGKPLKGATFLWTKSRIMLEQNSSFFNASNLASLTKDDFKNWLKDDSGDVPFKDPETRFALILDFGKKLLKIGSLHNLYKKVDGNLEAFVNYMENFVAYADFPFCKKSHLVCKMMERIKKWKMVCSTDFAKIPPLDYHLMNMAWKLEIIDLPSITEQKLSNYSLLPEGHEFLIRYKCAQAYQGIAKASKLDPYEFDDIIWSESRKYCQTEPYTCYKCFFDGICTKRRKGFPLVETHRY